MKIKSCYCESGDNSFKLVNQTSEYSGIEMMLDNKGTFRVRTYENGNNSNIFDSEDIVEFKYCPLCGRKFNK